MKRTTYTKKIKLKLVLLVVAVILLLMAIVMKQCGREKEKKQYQEYLEQNSTETEQARNESTEMAVTDTEESKTNLSLTVQITNLDEYATTMLGDNAELLNQSLAEWLSDKQIVATSGSIFYVLVPDNDPGSVDFFIHIDDSQGSIVMLAYHMRENVVTASKCTHTEEEIVAGVFEENGPSQSDVSATEDAEFLNSQEGTDATEGKN